MITLSLCRISEITFDSTHEDLEGNIREMQAKGFFVVSLNPDINQRIQVFCKKLFKDMPAQTYEMLDVPGVYAKWERIRQDARNQKYVW